MIQRKQSATRSISTKKQQQTKNDTEEVHPCSGPWRSSSDDTAQTISTKKQQQTKNGGEEVVHVAVPGAAAAMIQRKQSAPRSSSTKKQKKKNNCDEEVVHVAVPDAAAAMVQRKQSAPEEAFNEAPWWGNRPCSAAEQEEQNKENQIAMRSAPRSSLPYICICHCHP
jgi:hypothetical protein